MTVTSYGMEYPFGKFRSAVIGHVSSPPLTQPQPTGFVGVGESPDAVPALLSNRKNTGVIPMLF